MTLFTPTMGIDRKYCTSQKQKHFVSRLSCCVASFCLKHGADCPYVAAWVTTTQFVVNISLGRAVTPGIAWNADWAHLDVCCRELATYCVRDVVCQVRTSVPVGMSALQAQSDGNYTQISCSSTSTNDAKLHLLKFTPSASRFIGQGKHIYSRPYNFISRSVLQQC